MYSVVLGVFDGSVGHRECAHGEAAPGPAAHVGRGDARVVRHECQGRHKTRRILAHLRLPFQYLTPEDAIA